MNAARTIALASSNAGKLNELKALLSPLDMTVLPQSRWDVPEAVEDGVSFVENALIKARNAAKYSDMPSIADDSGLVVPALDNAPGVHSARYAGNHGDDAANNEKLLREMTGLEGRQRAAYFYCAMVYIKNEQDPVPLIALAHWWGEIAMQPAGDGGFGYDPLFRLPELSLTSAQLCPADKNRLSHRGKATRRLVTLIKMQDGR